MAIAFGSVILACQYGQQINSRKTLIASNSQKLELMNWKLQHAAGYQSHMNCVRDGDSYQISSGRLNHRALAYEPRSFIGQSNTVSVIRHSFDTQQPDAYMRLNPNRNLLVGSIEQTNDTLQTQTQVIDLDRNPAYLPNNREAVDNHIAAQEKAIALHEEISSCFVNHDRLGTVDPFPQFPYAD